MDLNVEDINRLYKELKHVRKLLLYVVKTSMDPANRNVAEYLIKKVREDEGY